MYRRGGLEAGAVPFLYLRGGNRPVLVEACVGIVARLWIAPVPGSLGRGAFFEIGRWGKSGGHSTVPGVDTCVILLETVGIRH